MRRILIISVAAALAGGGAYAAARPDPAEKAAREQAELAKSTAGMVAGKPTSCIDERDVGDNHSIGESMLVFNSKYSRRNLWINHPPGGCPELTSGRALRWHSTMTRMCRGDIVTVFDPVSHIEYGSCGLGDFTPYTRGG